MTSCSPLSRVVPRNAVQFTGSAVSGDSRGPGGALLLCVANTQIPCNLSAKGDQKSIIFTVINVRDRGWMKAPWYVFILGLFARERRY